MKKVIEFLKKRYKILIPIMVVFVLLIAVFFLYREYRYDNYRNREEVDVYQYFGGIKNNYTAIISYNLKKLIVDIKAKNKKVEYDATPIYYNNEDKIIFPSEMSIIFPLRDGNQYRLYKYARYQKIDDEYEITNGRESGIFNHFFLFDGRGLYFFSDEVKIMIDDKEIVTLSPNSYVEVVGGYTLTYYDKENDKSEMIEIEGKKVQAINDILDLSINERYFNLFGKKILLVPSENLKELGFDN